MTDQYGRNPHVLFLKSSTITLFYHLGLPNGFFLSDDFTEIFR